MEHLIIHIKCEIQYLGPAFLHYMYPFERYMAIIKAYVRNRARPEASIIEGYNTEEVIESCIDYIEEGTPIGVPTSRHEGRLSGIGVSEKRRWVDEDYLNVEESHFAVLQQLQIVEPYVNQHLEELRREGHTEGRIMKEHKRRFTTWFSNQNIPDCERALQMLALKPSRLVTSWQAYNINGYTFYTKSMDKKRIAQNSGVRVEALDTEGKKSSYYGCIEEICELDYGENLIIPVFRCQ